MTDGSPFTSVTVAVAAIVAAALLIRLAAQFVAGHAGWANRWLRNRLR